MSNFHTAAPASSILSTGFAIGKSAARFCGGAVCVVGALMLGYFAINQLLLPDSVHREMAQQALTEVRQLQALKTAAQVAQDDRINDLVVLGISGALVLIGAGMLYNWWKQLPFVRK